MCNFLKVSRSGYYEWLNNPGSNRDEEDKALTDMIKLIFEEGRSTYGSRRIKKRLEQQGYNASRKRIIRLMKEADLGFKTKRKFKATTNSEHNNPVAPNLLERRFNVAVPNKCWVGDITYIATKEGWLYLATVIDLYSRKNCRLVDE